MAKVLKRLPRGLGPSNGVRLLGRLERRGNRPFEALGQCTHTRKSGIRTARRRCICQHKAETGLGSGSTVRIHKHSKASLGSKSLICCAALLAVSTAAFDSAVMGN